jgi:hypothetical protein
MLICDIPISPFNHILGVKQFDILRMDLISSSVVCGFCLTSMKAFARAFLLLLLSHVKWLI